MREHLQEILEAGLKAADPAKAVHSFVRLEGEDLIAEETRFSAKRVFVVSVGKAAGAMADAAEELLGDRIAGGLVVTKDDHNPGPDSLDTLFASHPEPDERGVEAARKVAELVETLEDGDLLLALVSGGASALLADAAPPIELSELKELTGALLRSGADIGEINTVRKHVSTLKGGGLVRLASPAPVLALLLSDVVGDEPSSIASGLTTPDPTTLDDTQSVLKRYGIEPASSITEHLRTAEETLKPGDEAFERTVSVVCGGGRHAAEAAASQARDLGYTPVLLTTTLTGDATEAAHMYAAIAREVMASGNPAAAPCAIISGGEATVTVRGDGKGGPNLEFALALAVELEGVDGWSAFAIDTDGNDGSTDAAGGMVDGRTATKIRESEREPAADLAENDSYPALAAADSLVKTGPTGTNVNDLRVALIR